MTDEWRPSATTLQRTAREQAAEIARLRARLADEQQRAERAEASARQAWQWARGMYGTVRRP